MIVTPLENGIVLDHIKPGRGIELYNILKLGELDCNVALILNAKSEKMGKKDIIKIDEALDVNLDALGYIDNGITINTIENGVKTNKRHCELPERIVNVVKCKNPRCITSVEQGIDHIFKLADRENKVYRCIYCEMKAKN